MRLRHLAISVLLAAEVSGCAWGRPLYGSIMATSIEPIYTLQRELDDSPLLRVIYDEDVVYYTDIELESAYCTAARSVDGLRRLHSALDTAEQALDDNDVSRAIRALAVEGPQLLRLLESIPKDGVFMEFLRPPGTLESAPQTTPFVVALEQLLDRWRDGASSAPNAAPNTTEIMDAFADSLFAVGANTDFIAQILADADAALGGAPDALRQTVARLNDIAKGVIDKHDAVDMRKLLELGPTGVVVRVTVVAPEKSAIAVNPVAEFQACGRDTIIGQFTRVDTAGAAADVGVTPKTEARDFEFLATRGVDPGGCYEIIFRIATGEGVKRNPVQVNLENPKRSTAYGVQRPISELFATDGETSSEVVAAPRSRDFECSDADAAP
ncbi:hypothetical protein [Enhygromyxa salina]|uniref:Uncharacterized protein n=1 Tax=Enhygromyxa salina TaxID=215803 RepID=A0A2S9XL22_9BACT|nr:hypothetical protein [Enhygromyxa salina]PRP93578.1 hypothetical protein ENSA7_80060 [Enhygromyxa salina]